MDEKSGTDIDGYAVVAGHWPLAGPYSPARTAYAAQALTSLVDYLRHAVGATDGLAGRHDADRVLQAVDGALTGLPPIAASLEERRPTLSEG
ncbi:hypothetical protein [Cryptosporangium aurantiacum]|uniref:Uncharacterized protein n=1 Tax=Cryptosporangium aurantiacum TaxID=134849 RepID=A0A1M7KCX7_9ACTN|nr:hypothetical protein [Cryptosporangium aurantiacum]SHM63084.1 hypothetical protein SAMN05443668_1011079 [Cryptosporangium aurantiacum]